VARLALGELFQHPENEVIIAATQKLRTQISGKFDADILLCELNSLTKEVNSDHWTFTSPGVMIAGALILLIFRLSCWRKCCQGSQPMNLPTQSALMALPALAPLILNKHLDPIHR
jgi:hypothetical protein